jgi:phenylalanyl-tRNA synthetase alpha subunit
MKAILRENQSKLRTMLTNQLISININIMFRNTFLRDIIDVKHYQKFIQIKVSVYFEIAKRIHEL